MGKHSSPHTIRQALLAVVVRGMLSTFGGVILVVWVLLLYSLVLEQFLGDREVEDFSLVQQFAIGVPIPILIGATLNWHDQGQDWLRQHDERRRRERTIPLFEEAVYVFTSASPITGEKANAPGESFSKPGRATRRQVQLAKTILGVAVALISLAGSLITVAQFSSRFF